jgi:hypothetical protein
VNEKKKKKKVKEIGNVHQWDDGLKIPLRYSFSSSLHFLHYPFLLLLFLFSLLPSSLLSSLPPLLIPQSIKPQKKDFLVQMYVHAYILDPTSFLPSLSSAGRREVCRERQTTGCYATTTTAHCVFAQ